MFFIRKHFLMILSIFFFFVAPFQNQLSSMNSHCGYVQANNYLHAFHHFTQTLKLPRDICKLIFLLAYNRIHDELLINWTTYFFHARARYHLFNAYEHLCTKAPNLNIFNPSENFFLEINTLRQFCGITTSSELVMEIFTKLNVKLQHFAITKIHDPYCTFSADDTSDNVYNVTILLIIADKTMPGMWWIDPHAKGNIIKLEAILGDDQTIDSFIISTYIDEKSFRKIIENLHVANLALSHKICKPKKDKCIIQ